MQQISEKHILLFLVQFALLLGFSKLLGIFFNKWKQSTVTSDLLAGIILGPTILGYFFPAVHNFIFPKDIIQSNMIETVAWVGILLLLLVTGLEVNFTKVWKQKGQAIKISISDIIIPIIISGIPIFFFISDEYLVRENSRLIFTVFLATIMTISALPVAIRAMYDMKILKTHLGFLILSALSINDLIGWLIFTIILGIFSQASFNIKLIFVICGATIIFTVFALTIGKYLVDKILNQINKRSHDNTASSLTFICLLGMIFGAITQKIGIHSLFGFFIAGLIAGESQNLSEKSRYSITRMVYAVFVPIFFVNTGLKINFLESFKPGLVLFISAIGIIARYFAAYFGTIYAKTPKKNRNIIAILHTPGGEMHIVIGALALEYGLISKELFVAIITAAILSSIVLGPWLSYALKRGKKAQVPKYFSLNGIIESLSAKTKEEVIEVLCKKAGEMVGTSHEKDIHQEVMKRENLVSTGIEKRIAIPHARLSFIQEPIIIHARVENGVDWNSIDGEPAKFIFLVLTPLDQDDVQLQIYSFLLNNLKNEPVRNQLANAKSKNEILKILTTEPVLGKK